MTNIGYSDDTIGALLFFLLSLPITIMILSNLVQAFYSKTKYVTVEKIVKVEVPTTVYVERKSYNKMSSRATPSRTTPSQKKSSKSPLKTPDKVKMHALAGLKNLGLSATEGRNLIYKTINRKYYTDSKELLKDCMANM